MILQRPAVNCCTAQQKKHGHAAKETTGFCSVVGTGLLVIFFTGFAWSHIGIAMIVFIGRKKNRLVLFKNKYICPLQTLICTCPNTNRFYRPSLNKNMWMILQRPATICCAALPPPPRTCYSSTGHGCLRHVGNPLLHCSKLQTAHKNIGSGFAKPLQFFGFFLPLVISRWFQEQEYTAMG